MTVSGHGVVDRNLDAMAKIANQEMGRAVQSHAEDVMADAQENHVPVMDGHLRASGYVKSGKDEGGFWAKIGFSAAHARRTHENPRAGKTGGVSPSGRPYKKWAQVGGWKFLERPFLASEGRFVATVAATLRAALARRLSGGA